MRNIITKTAFTTGYICNRATAYELTCKQMAAPLDMEYVMDNGQAVHDLARTYFADSVTVVGKSNVDKLNETIRYINAGKSYICEAAFLVNHLFAAVDILHLLPNKHVEVFEVKSATKIKDIFYLDLAFQVYVLEHCGYTVDAAHLLFVNKDFVKHGDIDPREYFIDQEVTDEVRNLQQMVEDSTNDISRVVYGSAKMDETPAIGEYCLKPYKCPYWHMCSKVLPEDSIFGVVKMGIAKKVTYHYSGIRTMADLLGVKKLAPRFEQQARLQAEKSDVTEVKMDQLKTFMEKLVFPVSSMDFETEFDAIPTFDGTKPYDHQVTQFSVHVLRKRGEKLEHYEYLADPREDWRVPLAHELVKVIPETGSVVVWNKAMEYNRLDDLSKLPGNADIKDKILSIMERIVDLMVPFMNRVVYNRFMKGSYSVKKVLPALCPGRKDLSYDGMAINNGMLASMIFSRMLHGEIVGVAATIARRNLLTYCELDTFGPFAIMDAMFRLIDPKATKLYEEVVITHRDSTGRRPLPGDFVTTNVGSGKVVGYTPCFVKVMIGRRTVIRMAHNIFNHSGLRIPEHTTEKMPSVPGGVYMFRDLIDTEVRLYDYVVTGAKIGQVVGRTRDFLKVRLTDGKEVLRRSGFIVVR